MFLGDIAKSAGGTEVRYCCALDVIKNIVSYSYKRVLLTVHLAILLNEG